MPFKSKAQQRYMFATNPEIAKEMASKTSKKQFSSMPEHVADKKKGKKKGKLHVMIAALKEMSK